MATLVTRSGKGSPLTHAEVDANFTNLNTDKLELSGGTMTGNLSFGDNDKAIFGAGSDLQIYHDGSNSYISDTAVGDLKLTSNGTNITFEKADGTDIFNVATSGATTAYYNGNAKLATTSTGIDVTGNATFADNGKAIFGAGSDLQIYSDGNSGIIKELSSTGSLYVQADQLVVQNAAATENKAIFATDGAVTLYYDNASKLATTSTGIDVTGTVTADGLTVQDASSGRVLTGVFQNTTNALGTSSGISLRNSAESTSVNLTAERVGSNAGADLVITGYDNAAVEKNFLRITEGNDISFYEDTGTTAKFFWDASAERLGLGTTSPSSNIDIEDAAEVRIDLNSTAGRTYRLRSTTDSKFIIRDSSAAVDRLAIDSSGNVGIGTSSPSTYGVDNAEDLVIGQGDGNHGITISSFNTSNGTIAFSDTTNATVGRGYLDYDHNVDAMSFGTLSTERMRIDSSGNVGIGTTSPQSELHVSSSANADLRLSNDTVGNGVNDGLTITMATTGNASINNRENASTLFYTNNTERMRIDSGGNLLVGTTTADQANNSTVANAGIALRPSGSGALQVSRSGGQAATFNRLTSDGDIAVFRKNGTTVGSIGTAAGDLSIGNDDAYLFFDGGANKMVPASSSTGGASNGLLDLGASDRRFKDLYLSGGVYLGGTGAANKLDSYEEGTWTPSYADGSNSSISTVVSGGYGTYVKVGRTVTVYAGIYTSGLTSLSGFSGQLRITGLPFTSYNNGRTAFGSLIGTANTAAFGSLKTIPWCISVVANVSYITLNEYVPSGTESLYSYPRFDVTDLTLLGGNRNRLEFSITYETS